MVSSHFDLADRQPKCGLPFNSVGPIHLRLCPSSSSSSSRCARAAELKGTHKVTTFNTVYSDTSLFGVYYVAEPKDIDDLQVRDPTTWTIT